MSIRSQAEIAVMVLKAARGAKVTLAYAEDIAAAARWLGGDLAPVLEALQSGGPIIGAPATIDQALAAPGREYAFACAEGTELLGALLAEAGLRNEMRLTWRTSDGVVHITASDGAPEPPPEGRADVDGALWRGLSDLAARTYIAASTQSRSAGAGANLDDND